MEKSYIENIVSSIGFPIRPTSISVPPGAKVDLGCGMKKREGFIGVDLVRGPDVDIVIDVEKDGLPFRNGSVSHLYSSHCLEHLDKVVPVLTEVTRVMAPGGVVEICTPYAWHGDGFLIGHLWQYDERFWQHVAELGREEWSKIPGKHWFLVDVCFIVDRASVIDLFGSRISPSFGIRYFRSIVVEMSVRLVVGQNPTVRPSYWWAFTRYGRRFRLDRHRLPLPFFRRSFRSRW